MSQGGSFLDGFEDGAFSGTVGGAIGGAAFAGLGVAGSALGKGISCASKLGKAIKGTAAVSKVLSLGMAGFDMISLADIKNYIQARRIIYFKQEYLRWQYLLEE